jgi:hypothetical protein
LSSVIGFLTSATDFFPTSPKSEIASSKLSALTEAAFKAALICSIIYCSSYPLLATSASLNKSDSPSTCPITPAPNISCSVPIWVFAAPTRVASKSSSILKSAKED